MPILKIDRKVLKILFVVVIHAIVPILALNIYNLFGQRDFMQKWNIESGKFLVKTTAYGYDQILSSTRLLLISLSKIASVQNGNTASCNNTFENILKGQRRYANIFTMDLKGNVDCSGVPLESPLNGADRRYFKNALSSQDFSVGEYSIGRITKKSVLVLGYPILNSQEKPIGVIAGSLDLDWIASITPSIGNLPEGTSTLLLDSNGVILARQPKDEDWIGKNIKDYNTLTIEAFKKANDERIISLSKIPGQEIYFFADIPKDYYLNVPNTLFIKNLVLTGLTSILVFVILLLDWKILTKKYLFDAHKLP